MGVQRGVGQETASEAGPANPVFPMPIRVAVVCERPLVGEVLQNALGEQPDLHPAVFDSRGRGHLRRLAAFAPDVVLAFQPRLPADGRFLPPMVAALPHSAIVLVGPYSPGTQAASAALGAHGFLSFSAGLSDVVQTCRSLAAAGAGGKVGVATRAAIRGPAARAADVTLTPREREVFALVMAGEPTRRIADELGIQVHTARTHVQRILRKMGVHSRLEAIASGIPR